MLPRSLLGVAWALHLVVLVIALLQQPARFGFAPALSVTVWLVLTVYMIESRLYPQLQDVPVVSSWTGPIDRAMKGLPNFGYLDNHQNISYGIGFSGNGVATTVFASRIIKSLVEHANDEWANCGLVNQRMKLLPPEPFRFFGAHMVRDALVRKESLEDHDQDAGFVTRQLVAMAPAGYVPAQKK